MECDYRNGRLNWYGRWQGVYCPVEI
jgi:hypothetical protein